MAKRRSTATLGGAGKAQDICFAIMPFGGWFDGYYSSIYQPAINDAGLVPKRADDLYRPSTIVNDIWAYTRQAKLVLADLSGKNPNVFYELGLAHALAKPAILVAETMNDVPFDLRALRVIEYDKNEPNWGESLKEKITKAIREVLSAPLAAVLPAFLEAKPNAEEMERLMAAARATGSPEAEEKAAAECARLAHTTSRIAAGGLQSETSRRWLDQQYQTWRQATATTSHDAFLADRACVCMKRFSPHVMSVDFGEIDCAHYGSWSRYVEAIRRTDQLTWQLWQTAETLPDFRDKTLMLVLPDHGRELDQPGQSGFIHHGDFYTNQRADEGCRRTWMLAIGPGIKPGQRIDRPVPITAAAATGLRYLGLEASHGAAPPVLDVW